MKSILTSLTAIAVYSRCCDFGYPVKGILAGVIAGALAATSYEAIKKAPSDDSREYGQCLTNGIEIYHDNIISNNHTEVKKGGGTDESVCKSRRPRYDYIQKR